jgi:HEAT repeat protein
MEAPETILAAALALPVDSHERWDHVRRLHERGDSVTFLAAAALLDSPERSRRVLSADVLAQLGAARHIPAGERPFTRQTVELLLARLEKEDDPEVLASIAHAFGHLNDSRAAPALRALSHHADDEVRFAVVFGLSGLDDDVAVETLIELSADSDSDVRDWATFGIGSQIDRDDPPVRAALAARLDDPDIDAREEAIRGLAQRGDVRVIPALIHGLDAATRSVDPSRLEEATERSDAGRSSGRDQRVRT